MILLVIQRESGTRDNSMITLPFTVCESEKKRAIRVHVWLRVRRGLKFPLHGGPHYHLTNVIVCGWQGLQAACPVGLKL